jgi:hypothetical protein
MLRFRTLRRVFLLTVAVSLLAAPPIHTQTTIRIYPRPEPVAETRLLMQALNQPNFQGLLRMFQQKPADLEAWTFARGQALLIAETGNLLLLRPPKKQGQETWLDRAADLRNAAIRLAKAAGSQDYDKCRLGLVDVANACNRCHQTFRVAVRIQPSSEPAAATPPPPPALPQPAPLPKPGDK